MKSSASNATVKFVQLSRIGGIWDFGEAIDQICTYCETYMLMQIMSTTGESIAIGAHAQFIASETVQQLH